MGDKKEYIERGALIDIFNSKSDMATGTPKLVFANAAKMVELMPAADVAPVVHGRWMFEHDLERDPRGYFIRITCSCCGLKTSEKSNYCPKCGVKMDGGKERL